MKHPVFIIYQKEIPRTVEALGFFVGGPLLSIYEPVRCSLSWFISSIGMFSIDTQREATPLLFLVTFTKSS